MKKILCIVLTVIGCLLIGYVAYTMGAKKGYRNAMGSITLTIHSLQGAEGAKLYLGDSEITSCAITVDCSIEGGGVELEAGTRLLMIRHGTSE